MSQRRVTVLAYQFNFKQLVGRADFLRPSVWSRVFGLMRFRDESDKGTHKTLCKFRKSGTKTLAIIRQAFRKDSISLHGCLVGMLDSGQTVKGEIGEGQSQKHAHHFL
jgi:hypothetical protein